MKKHLMKYLSHTLCALTLLLVGGVSSAFATNYQATIPYIVDTASVQTLSLDLSASPSSMTLPANSTTLTWVVTGNPGVSCVASSFPDAMMWTGAKNSAGGSELINNLPAGDHLFSMRCDKAGEAPAMDSVIVRVVNSGPDLVAGATTPVTATVGVPLTSSGTVTNQGDINTPSSFPFFFQVKEFINGQWVYTDLSSGTTALLSSGASAPVTSPSSYTFVSIGNQFVRLCADKSSSAGGGWVAESDENNNCGPWTLVDVDPAQAYVPSVTLSAGPTTVYTGGSATLSWVSANVSSCTASATPASATWTGSKPIASSFPHESTGALSATTDFTISCTGSYGSASSTARVTVVAAGGGVEATLTATPNRIALGGSSILSWDSINATSCTGKNFPTGGATSGTTSVSPGVDTTYQMECTDGTSVAAAQATVTLKRRFLFIEY
jgi:hypothetical protein